MDKKSRDLVMGKLYLKNKDYKMAEKSLLEYLNLSPEDFQALKMLAQVYENLNNYVKSFEFYERSYLVEPERKGTLLDICRILLIDNSGLDHVDRKKWFKLAVQAFPTNPIVNSLRDSLPTFELNPVPSKINLENELLAKIDRLEQRLTGIEDTLARLAVSLESKMLKEPQVPKLPQMPVWPSLSAEPKKPDELKKSEEPKISLEPLNLGVQASPASKLPQMTAWPSLPAESKKLDEPKKLDDPKKSEEPRKLEEPKKPEEPKKLEEPKLFGLLSSSAWVKQEETKKSEEPEKSEASVIFQPKAPQPSFTPLSNNFSFGSFGSGSGNLFAESLKKNNLPTEGSWTTTTNKVGGFTQPVSNNDDDDGNDDDTVEAPDLPIENTCDMKPIEIKSGEEDEDIVFEHRCKLFRFRDKEYKERGLGNIKVLKHRSTNAGRLIMRRDLINLVCLNCWSCSKIERVRDTQVRFAGLDASDGEPVLTVFLAKFKTQELTDTFMTHLVELFPEE